MVSNHRKIKNANDDAANYKEEWEWEKTMETKSSDEPACERRLRPDNNNHDRRRKKGREDQCLKSVAEGIRGTREKLNLIGIAEPSAGIADKEKCQRATKAQDGIAHMRCVIFP